MRVDDALGPPGRARRVTHGGGAALLEGGPLHRFVGLDQRLVVDRPLRNRPLWETTITCLKSRACRNPSNASSSDSSTMIAQSSASSTMSSARPDAGAGSACGSPRRSRNREVGLEVLGLVPHQRRDAIAVAHAELDQRRPQPARPAGAVADVVRWISPSGRRETTLRDALSSSARSTTASATGGGRPSSGR